MLTAIFVNNQNGDFSIKKKLHLSLSNLKKTSDKQNNAIIIDRGLYLALVMTRLCLLEVVNVRTMHCNDQHSYRRDSVNFRRKLQFMWLPPTVDINIDMIFIGEKIGKSTEKSSCMDNCECCMEQFLTNASEYFMYNYIYVILRHCTDSVPRVYGVRGVDTDEWFRQTRLTNN